MNLKEHEDLLAKVEKAKEQLVQLRKQQADLEREKSELEELRSRQDAWNTGKKEVSEELLRSLAVLQREDSEVTRMGELIRGSRESFSAALDELSSVREEKWTSATLKDELQQALLVLEKARRELSTAKARIQALERVPASGPEEEDPGEGDPVRGRGRAAAPRLAAMAAPDLLRIGFWLALPAAALALAVAIILSML